MNNGLNQNEKTKKKQKNQIKLKVLYKNSCIHRILP